MRKVLTVCILAAAPLLAAEGGAITDAERAFLVNQLEQSKKDMLASIAGLTAAQWQFKPAPKVWSVAECAEHLILAEDYLFGASQGLLKTPVVPRPETSTSEQDQKLVAMVQDRSKKATAPEPITPSGKFATPADAAREFTARRDKTLAYARATTDDLRVHISKSPIGTLDAYQFLLLLASHTERHTAQIREVEANADYPKTVAKMQFLVTYSLVHGTLDEVTPDQMALLNQHLAYLKSQAAKGRISWGGRVDNSKQPRGFVLLEVGGEAEAREYLSNDPAVKGNVLQGTVEPFIEILRAPKT